MQLLLEDLLMTESSIELLVPNDHSHTHTMRYFFIFVWHPFVIILCHRVCLCTHLVPLGDHHAAFCGCLQSVYGDFVSLYNCFASLS